eukprot:TRINITY_DN6320_c1_g1_i1.p1 TRINITY_DN6320_c1_g1~~TRINITY_DN6320_c1_g1_i1.p1  ORF type:complete len:365 (-),score=93.82 TRINITY_DN6320_c1_g1_i1:201-1295(-)
MAGDGAAAATASTNACAAAAVASAGAGTGEMAAEDEEECIICFDALKAKGGAVPLPCSCRVAYCASCWDRALASSMATCGRALCPSCRCPMRVDFDAVSGRLTFSTLRGRGGGGRASGAGEEASAAFGAGFGSGDNWRKRLYEQAMPLQIRLLQRYGASTSGRPLVDAGATADASAASGGAGEPAVSGTSASSSATATAPGSNGSVEAEASAGAASAVSEAEAPRCVCGSRLRRVSVRDRVLAFVNEETPVAPPRSMLERLMQNPPIVCDICNLSVDADSDVWTCENGRRTVLHAVAYDVCAPCFALHAFGVEPPARERGLSGYVPYGDDDSASDSDEDEDEEDFEASSDWVEDDGSADGVGGR